MGRDPSPLSPLLWPQHNLFFFFLAMVKSEGFFFFSFPPFFPPPLSYPHPYPSLPLSRLIGIEKKEMIKELTYPPPPPPLSLSPPEASPDARPPCPFFPPSSPSPGESHGGRCNLSSSGQALPFLPPERKKNISPSLFPPLVLKVRLLPFLLPGYRSRI